MPLSRLEPPPRGVRHRCHKTVHRSSVSAERSSRRRPVLHAMVAESDAPGRGQRLQTDGNRRTPTVPPRGMICIMGAPTNRSCDDNDHSRVDNPRRSNQPILRRSFPSQLSAYRVFGTGWCRGSQFTERRRHNGAQQRQPVCGDGLPARRSHSIRDIRSKTRHSAGNPRIIRSDQHKSAGRAVLRTVAQPVGHGRQIFSRANSGRHEKPPRILPVLYGTTRWPQ